MNKIIKQGEDVKIKLLKGVEKFIESGRCYNINEIFEEGNEDANDMDCIIQYALFDKIIFG